MFLYIFISTVLTQITIDDLQNYINTNDIVMITSPTCKNCKNAKKILQINNVAYKNVDIKENPEAFAYISKKEGISYVPFLYYKKMFLKNFAMLKNYIPLNENVNPQT